MSIKNLIKNIIFILGLLLIVIITEKLNSIFLYQLRVELSIKYNYLAFFTNLIGYTIVGFMLGINNLLKEYNKECKWKLNYTTIIGLAIPSLIIGLLPILSLAIYKSTVSIPYNIFFLIFGLQLSKSIIKNDL